MTAVDPAPMRRSADRGVARPVIPVVAFLALLCAALVLSGALGSHARGSTDRPAGHHAATDGPARGADDVAGRS